MIGDAEQNACLTPARGIRSLVEGGWGDLTPMMSKPLGTLGLWTVKRAT